MLINIIILFKLVHESKAQLLLIRSTLFYQKLDTQQYYKEIL